MGLLAEWSPTAKEKDEDVLTSVQLYAYQPDDVAARWQRPIFGLGASPDNVFHEETHTQGAVAEVYAQYRYEEATPLTEIGTCSWTFDGWIGQKAKADPSRRNAASADFCSIRRRCAG